MTNESRVVPPEPRATINVEDVDASCDLDVGTCREAFPKDPASWCHGCVIASLLAERETTRQQLEALKAENQQLREDLHDFYDGEASPKTWAEVARESKAQLEALRAAVDAAECDKSKVAIRFTRLLTALVGKSRFWREAAIAQRAESTYPGSWHHGVAYCRELCADEIESLQLQHAKEDPLLALQGGKE